jgi:hypothetical protein
MFNVYPVFPRHAFELHGNLLLGSVIEESAVTEQDFLRIIKRTDDSDDSPPKLFDLYNSL